MKAIKAYTEDLLECELEIIPHKIRIIIPLHHRIHAEGAH